MTAFILMPPSLYMCREELFPIKFIGPVLHPVTYSNETLSPEDDELGCGHHRRATLLDIGFCSYLA